MKKGEAPGTRVSVRNTVRDMIIILGEGNPGALNVCMEIFRRGDSIDPQSVLGSVGALLSFDTYGIYGSDIWVLYKNICKGDTVLVLAVLRAIQLGLLQESQVTSSISAVSAGNPHFLDIEMVLKKVKTKLPAFDLP